MDDRQSPPLDVIRGCLFGVALGDAIGAPTEFLQFAQIRERWPPAGPLAPPEPLARVTDDTQMMLAVGEALLDAPTLAPQVLETTLREHFVRWNRSPENDRAPGMTCMRSCAALEDGTPWVDATQANSKGCGANMRVAPVAFLPTDERGAIAQFQGALTHGHPTAVAASELTAEAFRQLAEGTAPSELLDALRDHAQQRSTVYEEHWLGALWERPSEDSRESFLARGWGETTRALDAVECGLPQLKDGVDPCSLTGEGWVAEEALATALLCFLAAPDDPVRAVRLGAATNGDSDSIACIAGGLTGARHGLSAWPEDWVARTEYADRIAAVAAGLADPPWPSGRGSAG